MAADGTPEPAIRRCGAAIARLRTLRGWSRAKLIARLYDQIDPTAPVYDRISVAWPPMPAGRGCGAATACVTPLARVTGMCSLAGCTAVAAMR